jgi:hypothetical protein
MKNTDNHPFCSRPISSFFFLSGIFSGKHVVFLLNVLDPGGGAASFPLLYPISKRLNEPLKLVATYSRYSNEARFIAHSYQARAHDFGQTMECTTWQHRVGKHDISSHFVNVNSMASTSTWDALTGFGSPTLSNLQPIYSYDSLCRAKPTHTWLTRKFDC